MAIILCNGHPKTGTHLLQKVVQLFPGVVPADVLHGHVEYGDIISCDVTHHVHIIRDPKNVVISYARFVYGTVCIDTLRSAMHEVINGMTNYYRWTQATECLTVKFEHLLEGNNELVKISNFLGEAINTNHMKKVAGYTPTATGELSDWKDYRHFMFESYWRTLGGRAVDKMFGYV